jgi:hypothetical protein
MASFVENPLALAVIGGIFGTFALIVFLARRTLGSLVVLGTVIGVTLLLIGVERLVVTDREAVASSVKAALAAVESNDLSAVLALVDPAAATVRADAQSLMPLVKVNKARSIGDIEVDVNDAADLPTARSRVRGFLDGVHSSSGMHVGYFNQQVDLQWIKRGDQWLINGYTAYYEDQPIDAVGSAISKRPVPGR